MKRVLLAITVGLTVFGLVFGAAAGLNVNTDQVASGTSLAVSGCDDAVDVSFGLATGDISSVVEITVDGIAAACVGENMDVEVLAGTATATASVQVAAATHTMTLSTPVAAADVTQVNVTITG